jgi:hypothetical protein
MQPLTIYQSFIELNGNITTKLFPGRNAPELFPVEAFDVYSQSNLSDDAIKALANFLSYKKPLPTNRRGLLDKRQSLEALHAFRLASGLSNKIVADAIADAMYWPAVKANLGKMPKQLRATIEKQGLLPK